MTAKGYVTAYCQKLSLCKLSCFNDYPAIVTQGVVIVEATDVFPLDLEADHQVGASRAK